MSGADGDDKPGPRAPVLLGSAAAGGLLGFLIGGPLFGALGAGALGLAATTGGRCGEVARTTGETVLVGADKVGEAVHASGVGEKVAALDAQYKVSATTKETVQATTKETVQAASSALDTFEKEHHLADRAVAGLHAVQDSIRGNGGAAEPPAPSTPGPPEDSTPPPRA